jgi:hypothetical protein
LKTTKNVSGDYTGELLSNVQRSTNRSALILGDLKLCLPRLRYPSANLSLQRFESAFPCHNKSRIAAIDSGKTEHNEWTSLLGGNSRKAARPYSLIERPCPRLPPKIPQIPPSPYWHKLGVESPNWQRIRSRNSGSITWPDLRGDSVARQVNLNIGFLFCRSGFSLGAAKPRPRWSKRLRFNVYPSRFTPRGIDRANSLNSSYPFEVGMMSSPRSTCVWSNSRDYRLHSLRERLLRK